MRNDNIHSSTHHPRRPGRVASVAAVVTALAMLAASCGDDDDAAEPTGNPTADAAEPSGDTAEPSGEPTVEIATPTDGAQVGQSFDVDLAINFPIGDPDTGRDHVHLYYDGNTDGEYGIAYEDTFTVSGLAPGEHKIQAVVAHADHSLTDSRSMEITVDVTADDSGTGTTDTPPTSGRDLGY